MNFKLLLAALITVAASPSMDHETLVGLSMNTVGSPIQKDELKNIEGKQPTSFLVHPGQPDSLASRVNQLETEFREKIEEINTKTRRKSHHQDKEIEILKILLEEEKKFSEHLSGRISQLEASTNPSSMENDQLLARPKRPYRLLPPHISLEKDIKDGGKNQQFNGPATNCEELGLIGYTLNGYYLVKKSTDLTKRGTIGFVYCQFQQLHGQIQVTTSDVRTLLDYLDNSDLEKQITDLVSNKMLHKTSLSPSSTRANTKDNGVSNNLKGPPPKLSIPPSSCQDLLLLGHISDGLFLVKNKRTEMIQTVFCQFSDENQVVTSDVWSLLDIENFNLENQPPKSTECTYMHSVKMEEDRHIHRAIIPTRHRTTKKHKHHKRHNHLNQENKVICENVFIKFIKKYFQKTHLTNKLLDSIELTLFSENEWIPADILGDTKTKKLVIKYYSTKDPVALLQVNTNAFRSTKDTTESVKLINFDSSQLDLGFLSEFSQLTNLEFEKVHHLELSLPTLPLLPKLTLLGFDSVTGLNDSTITFPTLSTGGLKRLELFSGEHTDASVSRILDWILLSSATTMENLKLNQIGITQIPPQIPSFTALKELTVASNRISAIKKGTLSFSVPVLELKLWNNKISSIEPNSFQGNFRDADVNLNDNSLTRFDESVFRPMLEQMVSGRGKIQFQSGNAVSCSNDNICPLVWVISDSKLRGKAEGTCSNGTDFSGLEFKRPLKFSTSSGYENDCKFSALQVNCENTPIKGIKEFFKKTDLITNNLLDSITLTLLSGDEFMSGNILGNAKTAKLEINYDHNICHDHVPLLKLDVNAFQSTKNHTTQLILQNFNSQQLDLSFLSGFSQLTNLTLLKIHHIKKSLSTLPIIPKLTSITLFAVRGLDDSIISFPTLSTINGLKSFTFINYDGRQNDGLVSRMLDWILLSSAKTLEYLTMDSVGITEVPSQIPSFTALKHLDLNGNLISIIKNKALSFFVPTSTLRLSNNNLSSIEPGAFQGNFSDADVYLNFNNLTKLNEPVFRPMLEQMTIGRGKIEFGGNIDCSTENMCHLAWVIRVRNLRAKVLGDCSNGIDFSELGKTYRAITTKKPPRRRSTSASFSSTYSSYTKRLNTNLKLIKIDDGFDHCPVTNKAQ